MPASSNRIERFVHPLQAILLSFPVAFSCAAVASDITYLNSAVMQWSNFSAWLVAGTAMFSGAVLIWAIALLLFSRRARHGGRPLVYVVLLALVLILSVLNSLHHARDAWASVSTLGLVLSIATAMFALAAAWVGFSANRQDVRP